MKVFDNIQKWKKDAMASASADEANISLFEDELMRIITELIPLRDSEKLTRAYYENILRYTTHAKEHYRLMKEQELNGMKVESYEYTPRKGECILPEDELHSALLQIIKDDKYSFGYLYWLLGTECNRQAGFAMYSDVVIPKEIIEYAIKFDFEETKAKGEKIANSDERRTFYILQKAESALVLNEDYEPRLASLKTTYESKLDVLCELIDKQQQIEISKTRPQMTSRAKRCINTSESIGREEHLEEIEEDDYLVAYDFDNCPINVAMEPYNTNLASYHITKTIGGLSDNDPVFSDLIFNLCDELIQANQEEANLIFNSARDLLKSLFRSFIIRAYRVKGGDFEAVLSDCKYWCAHSVNLIHAAHGRCKIPVDLRFMRCEDGEIAYIANSKNLMFFRYEISEYCFQLIQSFVMEFPDHPYHAVYNTIPFSYEPFRYFSMKERISSIKILTKEERIYAEFIPNCGGFQNNLTTKLRKLDKYSGKGELYSKQKEALCDSFVTMADDYLKHLELDGVKDYGSLHFAIMLWCWFVRGMVDIIFDHEIDQLELKKTSDETLNEETKFSLVRQIREYQSVKTLILKRLVPIQKDFYDNYKSGTEQTVTITDNKGVVSSGIEYPGNNDEQHKTQVVKKAFFSPRGYAKINTQAIYQYTLDRLKTKITLEDFEEAIMYADFKKLLEDGAEIRAKDYPLIIIHKLRDLFDRDWYDACCENLGMTATRVSGFHREGKIGKYLLHFPCNLTMAK